MVNRYAGQSRLDIVQYTDRNKETKRFDVDKLNLVLSKTHSEKNT